MLIPLSSSLGLYVLQKWIVGFDPNTKMGLPNTKIGEGLKIPTWITLYNILDNFKSVS